MRTAIYIDGFNFYEGCVRGTQYKWVDFHALFSNILNARSDDYQITHINYCTALVKNEGKQKRQRIYIRALTHHYRGVCKLNVLYGGFTKKSVPNPNPPPKYLKLPKEKRSDVNLATHMVHDAWLGEYECAVLVSNDSDFAEALKIVKDAPLQKSVVLIVPRALEQDSSTAQPLRDNADKVEYIYLSQIKAAQLPDNIPGIKIQKPREWRLG